MMRHWEKFSAILLFLVTGAPALALEPSWWSFALKPTNASIRQLVDKERINSKFESSNFSLMAMEAAAHHVAWERFHFDARFAFQRRVATSETTATAVDEIRSGLYARYSLYESSELELSAGTGLEAFKLPYFSPLSLGGTEAEFGFSSGLAVPLVVRGVYLIDERSWASAVFTYGLPFRFDADRSDEFSKPGGMLLRAAFEYKRMFSHVMFWDFALCFSFDQIDYEQTSPFSARNRLENFEQWGRVGLGARF